VNSLSDNCTGIVVVTGFGTVVLIINWLQVLLIILTA
jgi:hypothetical protein